MSNDDNWYNSDLPYPQGIQSKIPPSPVGAWKLRYYMYYNFCIDMYIYYDKV